MKLNRGLGLSTLALGKANYKIFKQGNGRISVLKLMCSKKLAELVD